MSRPCKVARKKQRLATKTQRYCLPRRHGTRLCLDPFDNKDYVGDGNNGLDGEEDLEIKETKEKEGER